MKACAFLCVHSRLPDINQASAFSIGLRVWQGLNDEGLATPEVGDALVINPSSANGLGGCSREQIGLGSYWRCISSWKIPKPGWL
jgi:hypothetical protein